MKSYLKRRIARSEEGFALIVTLMVTALLVTVIVEFAYRTYITTARAENFAGAQRAALLAANGVEVATEVLKQLLDISPNIRLEDGLLRFTRQEGDFSIDIRIEDELARLSTDVVYSQTGAVVRSAWLPFVRLVEGFGLSADLADSLADWIDTDEEPRSYGAESFDYYTGLAKPYNSANSRLGSTEELMMVKGFTPEVFRLLKPYVTVYNDERRVNINTASKEVLLTLSENMTESMVMEIVEYRMAEPFKAVSDIMNVPGFETVGIELQGRIRVKSDIFRVYSRASAGESVREVEAVITVDSRVLYWRQR